MIADAEKFYQKCISTCDVDTFNELRFIAYHKKYLEFDTERFPPTSDQIAYIACTSAVLYMATLCFSGKH